MHQAATLREAVDAVAHAEAAETPFAVVLADCRLVVGGEYTLLQKLIETSRLPIIGMGAEEGERLGSDAALSSESAICSPIRFVQATCSTRWRRHSRCP